MKKTVTVTQIQRIKVSSVFCMQFKCIFAVMSCDLLFVVKLEMKL